MNKKILYYAAGPVMVLALLGATTVSAHETFGFGQQDQVAVAQRQQDMFTQEAALLGVSVDDVKNAWAKGESFQQLAQEKGITQDQLQQKMADARKQQMADQLKALVDKGVITQAQADSRLQFMQQQKMFKTGKGFGRGRGHGIGM